MQAFTPVYLSLSVLEGVWACKARLIYEVGLGLILLTRLVYDDPHRRAASLYFTVACLSKSVAGEKNGAKSNLFGLKACCCLRKRGIRGWDEARGPAPGDSRGRNMPAKNHISQSNHLAEGEDECKDRDGVYHNQHHHHCAYR